MILYPSGLLITDFGTIEDGVPILSALDVLSRAAGKTKRLENVLKVSSNYILKVMSFVSGQKTLDTPRLVSIFKI